MKIRSVIFFIYIFILTVIQTTWLDYIKFLGVKPNLLLVSIICYAIFRGNVEGAVFGFFAGLFHDLASGGVIGLYALLGLYLGLVLGSINKRLYRENFFIVILTTFISSVVYELIVYIFITFIDSNWDFRMAVFEFVLPEAVYNTVAAIFIFWSMLKINNWAEKKKSIKRKY